MSCHPGEYQSQSTPVLVKKNKIKKKINTVGNFFFFFKVQESQNLFPKIISNVNQPCPIGATPNFILSTVILSVPQELPGINLHLAGNCGGAE